MGLRHAVITSVDRDDLPDYGAQAFVGVIRQIRRQAPALQGRGADAGLPGRRDAAGQGDRRAARRLQPQRRGRPAPLPGRAARLHVRALLPRPAQRQGDGRRRGDDQVRPDGRPRRELRGDGRRARHAARAPRPGAHRRPVPPSDRAAPSDRPLLAPRRVRRARARRPTRWGSSTSPPVRSCAAATTPTNTSPRTSPATGRWQRRRSRDETTRHQGRSSGVRQRPRRAAPDRTGRARARRRRQRRLRRRRRVASAAAGGSAAAVSAAVTSSSYRSAAAAASPSSSCC